MRLDADRVLARLSWLGYVVVPGWLVLTGLMVLAYRRIPDDSSPVARIAVIVLIAATAAFYYILRRNRAAQLELEVVIQ